MSRRTTTTHTSAFHDSERDLVKAASTSTAGRHRAAAETQTVKPALVPGPTPVKRVRAPRPVQAKM